MKQLILDSRLNEQRYVSFTEMTSICQAADNIERGGTRHLLRVLYTEFELKPSFTTHGYTISPLSAPNMECAPLEFSFTPDFPTPVRSTNIQMFPLIKRNRLDEMLVHSIRWFRDPLRPGRMLPLRLSTHYLGVEHPTSRIYVDVPVVLDPLRSRTFAYIRVSLLVFEILLESQAGEYGSIATLQTVQENNRKTTSSTNWSDCDKAQHEDLFEEFYGKHLETNERLRKYVKHNDNAHSASLIADHLVGFRR